MTFGYLPFGHAPFGGTVASTPNIQDLANNVLATPASAQMLGWQEPAEVVSPERLNLDMYRFIIQAIRDEDARETLFLKRFISGFQTVWQTVQDSIFNLKTLWIPSTIPSEQLKYLKNIVGWTKPLDGITDNLDDDALRRLIANSVAIWKTRGPEDAFINIINLLTGVRVRMWNWFDYRWIVGETSFTEDRQGYDVHLLNSPGSGAGDEYTSNLRVVDDGELDKDLVVELVKLMKAVGERVEITYVDFMDQFIVDGDAEQWSPIGLYDLTVSGGYAELDDLLSAERVVVNVDNADYWSNYLFFFRGQGIQWESVFYYVDEDNYYSVLLDTVANEIVLSKNIASVPTTISAVSFLPWGTLQPDLYYGMRVQISPEGAANRIKVYIDSVLIVDDLDTSILVQGKAGFGHPIGSKVIVDDAELIQLPADTDTIGINA